MIHKEIEECKTIGFSDYQLNIAYDQIEKVEEPAIANPVIDRGKHASKMSNISNQKTDASPTSPGQKERKTKKSKSPKRVSKLSTYTPGADKQEEESTNSIALLAATTPITDREIRSKKESSPLI